MTDDLTKAELLDLLDDVANAVDDDDLPAARELLGLDDVDLDDDGEDGDEDLDDDEDDGEEE